MLRAFWSHLARTFAGSYAGIRDLRKKDQYSRTQNAKVKLILRSSWPRYTSRLKSQIDPNRTSENRRAPCHRPQNNHPSLGCGSGRDQAFLSLRRDASSTSDARSGETSTRLWRSVGVDHLDKALARAADFLAVYGTGGTAWWCCDTLRGIQTGLRGRREQPPCSARLGRRRRRGVSYRCGGESDGADDVSAGSQPRSRDASPRGPLVYAEDQRDGDAAAPPPPAPSAAALPRPDAAAAARRAIAPHSFDLVIVCRTALDGLRDDGEAQDGKTVPEQAFPGKTVFELVDGLLADGGVVLYHHFAEGSSHPTTGLVPGGALAGAFGGYTVLCDEVHGDVNDASRRLTWFVAQKP